MQIKKIQKKKKKRSHTCYKHTTPSALSAFTQITNEPVHDKTNKMAV